MGKFKTRTLKSGKFQIYDAKTGRVATKEQRKEYLRLNIDLLPKSLSPQDKRTAAAIKGGLSRSKGALSDKSGKFLSKKMEERVNKLMGGKLDAVIKAKGAKDLKDALKKDANFRDNFFNILDKTESEFWFNSNQYQSQLNDFPGKIFINGKEVTKVEAMKAFADIQAAAAQNYKKGFDFASKFKFKGLREINITLPDINDLGINPEAFERKYGNDFKVYGSP